MNQKNRLLREAYLMLASIASGAVKPLGYIQHMHDVLTLRDRIAKNLKITEESRTLPPQQGA